MEKVKKESLENRIQFLGYRTDVPDLLSILNVFVHASIKPEPFGMVILEAMAAKRPVIATALGGPLEILENEKCGLLVPPKDTRALIEGCQRYLDDPSFSKEMGN
ncbi:MAG: glycosyltransferase, partial [Candidatus Dadabacteria bacterium]|nr:glycosyltransferase [Candidatus Dadabacteria bacterium]